MSIVATMVAVSLSASLAPTPNSLAISLIASEVKEHQGDRVLCLEVDGKDAPSSVLNGVESKENLVVLGSECQRSMGGSYHLATHRDAMFISVENFRPTSNDKATVNFNLYVAGKWAVYKMLEVQRSSEGWAITRVLKHSEA